MNDRPSARELIDAVRVYLEKELLPALTDARQRYQTLIAANVLTIAGRELDAQQEQMAQECEWLTKLLGNSGDVRTLNEQLCQQIRQGQFDDPVRFREAVTIVRRMVVQKLEIANPRYLQSVQAAPSGH